jgi:3-mercaptopyruvate sulfurtransferase SseA
MSDFHGPFIPASPIYFGTTYLTQKTLRTVERYPNGAIPGARNKHWRRILRAHAKKRMSTFEVELRQAQMKHAKIRSACDNAHEAKREIAFQRNAEIQAARIAPVE